MQNIGRHLALLYWIGTSITSLSFAKSTDLQQCQAEPEHSATEKPARVCAAHTLGDWEQNPAASAPRTGAIAAWGVPQACTGTRSLICFMASHQEVILMWNKYFTSIPRNQHAVLGSTAQTWHSTPSVGPASDSSLSLLAKPNSHVKSSPGCRIRCNGQTILSHHSHCPAYVFWLLSNH